MQSYMVCEKGTICQKKVYGRSTFSRKVVHVYKRKGVAHRGGASPYKHFFREGIPMATTVSTPNTGFDR